MLLRYPAGAAAAVLLLLLGAGCASSWVGATPFSRLARTAAKRSRKLSHVSSTGAPLLPLLLSWLSPLSLPLLLPILLASRCSARAHRRPAADIQLSRYPTALMFLQKVTRPSHCRGPCCSAAPPCSLSVPLWFWVCRESNSSCSRDVATAMTNMAPATAASKAENIISGHFGLLSSADISRAAVMEPRTRRRYSLHRMCSTQLLVHLCVQHGGGKEGRIVKVMSVSEHDTATDSVLGQPPAHGAIVCVACPGHGW
jgi:hypothetical protein